MIPEVEAHIDPDSDLSDIKDLSSLSSSYTYSDKTVAVFVLDVRTNKDPWTDDHRDRPGDFLGERQWTWFEQALQRSNAAVNVIVNGLQVQSEIFLSDYPNVAESWNSFPYSKQRLINAIMNNHHPKRNNMPILISGDVHMTQLSRDDCYDATTANDGDRQTPKRSLVEMTTSGMTHSW